MRTRFWKLSNFSELNIKKHSENTHTHRENQVFITKKFKLPNATMVLRNLEGRHHLGHFGT